MKDVAAAAKVSDATVSRVLAGTAKVSDAAREAVLDAIETTGYVRNGAARQLAGSAPNVVGLMMRDVRNPYYGVLHSELQARSAEHNLRMLTVSPVGSDGVPEETMGLQHLLEQRVRAIVVARGMFPVERLAPFASFVPIVVIGRDVELAGINSIAYDERANGELTADAVLERGHRRVAVVIPGADVSLAEHTRADAMVSRITARGGTAIRLPVTAHTTGADEVAQIIQLARSGAITAAMFPSDERLLPFLTAARDEGLRIPEDVSVTGCNGVMPGLDLLGLSTTRLPVETVARRAIEVVAEHLAGRASAPTREVHAATFLPGRTLATVSPG